ncbi:uncharacterized protein [Venturia canescens]|uniref:uncharacterized protein n=1 Tax=Venturia canescens TaxID=32260 RepID=UPI001C9D6352|nr:uncharacterized protein LOC122407339 [Venturia canescens]
MGPCPMSYILIFAAFFLDYKQTVIGSKLYKNEDNIGTVLFEKSACGKRCWSSEEFAVLNSRRMFQDILPQVSVINCQNDQYIALLMDYFHICLECVRKLSIGKTKHIMLKALADTMGGYLKVHILPLTKHSYYAGDIKYHNAKRLFELFEELKSFLHTNGDGWHSPRNPDSNHIEIPPINIAPSKSTSICDELIIYTYPRESSECVMVPIPFLDDNAQPNSIALPFRKDNLYSLYSEKSVFALVRYYVASVKCIKSKSDPDKRPLHQFNEDLYDWLSLTVSLKMFEVNRKARSNDLPNF